MLKRMLNWGASPTTPQDDFRKHHARLCTPPLYEASAKSSSSSSSDATPCHAHVVDPYHLIVCQHGVLSTSADFDNVIADLFIHHEVSVLEAVERAEIAVKTCSAPFSSNSRSGSVNRLPRTAAPTVTNTAAPNELPPSFSFSHSPGNTAETSTPSQEKAAAAAGAALRPDTALTAEQRARRDAYQRTFHLSVEYPNRTNGRLYRSGNLRVFSPGSNNYLRSDAGTLACAQKMLSETVPQIHAWLDDVETRERQRQAQWAVYARTVGTPEAARLANEAAQPLPACLSFMAHSFGGIIERECLYLLLADEHDTRKRDALLYQSIVQLRHRLQVRKVTFENFLNIATPHCGAGECLWWPIYFGAWCLARLRLCQTYDELILSDAEKVLQTRLLDAPHLKVLELFRRRVLFANTHRDLLVGFGTCSLIFENVDTDHTKFVGVAARDTHCAAAFADDRIEISKPILLRSFAEEEEAAASAMEGATRRVKAAATTTPGRTHTLPAKEGLHDAAQACPEVTIVPLEAFSLAREGGAGGTISMDIGASGVGDSTDEDEMLRKDGVACTLRPQPTYSSLAGLTASPTSAISAASSSSATMLQESAFAAAYTIGRDVPAHVVEEVTLEDVVGPCGWARETGSEMDESAVLTVVIDSASGFPKDGSGDGNADGGMYSPSSPSVSPAAWEARSLTVLPSSEGCSTYGQRVRYGTDQPYSPFSPRCAGRGGSDSDSAASSRRSRGSRVTSVLRDPRWAAEHVRQAASVVHGEVRRRLSAAAARVAGSSSSGGSGKCGYAEESATTLAPSCMTGSSSAGGLTSLTAVTAATEDSSVCSPLMASHLIAADDIPQYRKTPRAIAARLRERLSWRVRAVRFDNLIPVGHVACLGNWAFCGRSPLLVQAVAEELLIVLN